ncbi:MAG: efflux RND transporter periplasmic adaptor subunit [Sandaracinaceae bacterium]|nr:efflux RND transporter periplasmic adaptor subunit [Sandaracinaceae bacterium]
MKELELLGIPNARKERRGVGGFVIAFVVIGVVGLLFFGFWPNFRQKELHFLTAPLRRGEFIATLGTTGTLRPWKSIDVLAEVGGRIRAVYAEVNQKVRAGEVLAELDPSGLEGQLRIARANLAVARAMAKASRVALVEAQRRLKRSEALYGRALSPQVELEQAQAAVSQAQAELEVAQARLLVAEAEVHRLEEERKRLVIRSPIDGIVLVRRVEGDQLVTANPMAPLFVIAQGLERLRLEVSIDEADIGQVREGMEARFSVDAYPDQEFSAKIWRIHLSSQLVANVVTYLAELEVENSQGLLRPGMTAKVSIFTARKSDELLVPSPALRFVPPLEAKLGPPRRLSPSEPTLWILEKGKPRPISVQVIGNDGKIAAVQGPGLKEGMKVITGTASERER